MRALPWLSDTLRRLNPRERRVVVGGALVSVTALAIVLVAVPLARAWASREESSVLLNRVDVASQPRSGQPGLLVIPVQLQGQGDVYGLVAFLSRLERGEKLLALDELSLNAGFNLGFGPQFGPRLGKAPQILSWSLRLHGLYRAASGARGS
jgi:hypothetical protein